MRWGSLFQEGSDVDKNSWMLSATVLSSEALGTIESCCDTNGSRTGMMVSIHDLHSFLTRSHGMSDTDWKELSLTSDSEISAGMMGLSKNGFTTWMIVHGLISAYVFPPEMAMKEIRSRFFMVLLMVLFTLRAEETIR